MKKKKTPYEASLKVFWNVTDIMDVLGMHYRIAKRLFEAADKIDSQQEFRAEPKKVRRTVVCKLAQIDLRQRQRELKEAEAVQEHTAVAR